MGAAPKRTHNEYAMFANLFEGPMIDPSERIGFSSLDSFTEKRPHALEYYILQVKIAELPLKRSACRPGDLYHHFTG